MTWRDVECKECGWGMPIGLYWNEYEHEKTEWTITVICGNCKEGEKDD